MKQPVIVMVVALSAALSWAQAPAGNPPILDGAVADSEYSAVQVKDGFTVAARLSQDSATLYVAVSAKTTGWIAVGLGSLKMNGAFMVLGSVDGGKPSVSYELGKGHGHSPVPAPGAASFVRESGDTTTLELSLPAGTYVKNGKLQLLAAFGSKDSFKSIHSRKTALELAP